MDQTLDFIWEVQREPSLQARVLACMDADTGCTITIDRHKLTFDPTARAVTVRRASDTVPFACKIGRCRIPYPLLRRMLAGNWEDMTGFQWL